MFTTRMKEFQSELTTGWEEASESDDQVTNTKVIIQQCKEAQKGLSKVIAVSAKIGGPVEVLDAMRLSEDLEYIFNGGGYSNASVIIALAIELMASIDTLVEAAEVGIKAEEVKGHN